MTKHYVSGKTVMISQLDGYDGLPIDSQVIQTCATCHFLWIYKTITVLGSFSTKLHHDPQTLGCKDLRERVYWFQRDKQTGANHKC